MVDFAKTILPQDKEYDGEVELLSNTLLPMNNSIINSGDFKIVKTQLKCDLASKYLSCHTLMFSYRLEYCHYIPQTKVYMITLQSTSQKDFFISNFILCHTQTNDWDPDYVVFKILKVKPGSHDICHWSDFDAFAFVKMV